MTHTARSLALHDHDNQDHDATMTDTTAPSPALPPKLETTLQSLNASQRKAVLTTEGPALVLAGAGTGKTTVLTARLAYLVAHQHCPLNNILAVTFTNKAAGQMKQRLAQLLGQEELSPPWIGTFHHIGVKILRRHHDAVGLPARFLILDTDDQLRLLKQTMKQQNLDEKAFPPRLFLWAIGRLKDRALGPDQLSHAETKRLLSEPARAEALGTLYTAYQDALTAMGAADFGDLILLCLILFRKQPAVLHHYQQTFRYILVDEYQDTNVAQYVWLRLLAGSQGAEATTDATSPAPPPNICCVGDEDQSIYRWRGAEIDHILRFEKDFPGTQVVKLEDNYRSTAPILNAAATLIANNKERLGKTLRPALQQDGEAITLKSVHDDRAEARFIAHQIGHLLTQGIPPQEIAILVRATFQTREIEEALIAQGIPYRLVGATRFYERLEIKDALSYLRFLVHSDDNLSLERLLATPKRGLGTTTLQKLYQRARDTGTSLWHTMETNVKSDTLADLAAEPLLGKAAHGKLQTFVTDALTWKQQTAGKTPAEMLDYILDASGYLALWKGQNGEDARGRLENLRELARVIQEFDTLDAFLEHALLVSDRHEDATQTCSLMTLHTAKGLEFEAVFLAGWEENLFPHPKAMEESGLKGLEEERRLAYVGLTRAKKHVWITFASSRRMYGGWQPAFPSRFLAEMEGKTFNPQTATHAPQHTFPPRQRLTPRTAPAAATKDEWPFKPGSAVTHAVFGDGVLENITGPIATVRFKDATHKILARFLVPSD